MKSRIVVLVLAASLALAALLHIYHLTDFAGGTLFWKKDEAYLFLGAGHLGYRVSYLKFPFVVIGEYFYAPPSNGEVRTSYMVIRITPSSTERHAFDEGYGWDIHSPLFLTPLDDGFYAMCPGLTLCKWTATGYEPVTKEESQRLGGIDRLERGNMNNRIVNGWHVCDTNTLEANGHLEISLVDSGTISVENRGKRGPLGTWIVIRLERPGRAPEILYDVNGIGRRVSRRQYEEAIGRP